MSAPIGTARLLDLLRIGLLVIAGVSIAALVLELVFLRHWGATRTIVWVGVGALAAALVLLVIRPVRSRVRAAQGLAVVACLIGALGVGFHTIENLDAGPLDRDYADRWEGMSDLDRFMAATTGGVGPAPTLAPGALAQIAALLLLASLGQPASERDEPSDPGSPPVAAG